MTKMNSQQGMQERHALVRDIAKVCQHGVWEDIEPVLMHAQRTTPYPNAPSAFAVTAAQQLIQHNHVGALTQLMKRLDWTHNDHAPMLAAMFFTLFHTGTTEMVNMVKSHFGNTWSKYLSFHVDVSNGQARVASEYIIPIQQELFRACVGHALGEKYILSVLKTPMGSLWHALDGVLDEVMESLSPPAQAQVMDALACKNLPYATQKMIVSHLSAYGMSSLSKKM